MTDARRKIDIPAAQAMRDAGQSYRVIGRAFGVSGTAVYFALNPDKRYFPGPRRGRSWTAREDAQLLDMIASGAKYRHVAKALKRSVGSVAGRKRKLLTPPTISGTVFDHDRSSKL